MSGNFTEFFENVKNFLFNFLETFKNFQKFFHPFVILNINILDNI